ncbi:DNA-binding CsgD family transcriptional regulator [Neobacillus niacini]|uniref:helix-turn-helix transcriptional regulator n=1 Tax=Neobacillus driksii TaxID=3035913 RepID=UPI0027812939|nr:LuxR C-terminal-related transcriptional regulator [Neobacillus niacini]MDQ0970770.1 DNA-binding CsgD family transcriptional regulator [Neobacillus niacini]
MASQYTLMDKVVQLEETASHEEKLYKILELYMSIYPVRNSYLFRFSPLGYLGEGIIMLNTTGIVYINDIRDNIRTLPIIYSAILERRAKYCSGIEFLKQTSSKYILSANVNSMAVIPICFDKVVIGYICTTEFSNHAVIDEQTLTSLTDYGRIVGKYMEKTNTLDETPNLSKRELEVMRKISWGESMKEMADAMDISELTVKQYVKSAIKKLGAHNRSHAVSELLRRGIIS